MVQHTSKTRNNFIDNPQTSHNMQMPPNSNLLIRSSRNRNNYDFESNILVNHQSSINEHDMNSLTNSGKNSQSRTTDELSRLDSTIGNPLPNLHAKGLSLSFFAVWHFVLAMTVLSVGLMACLSKCKKKKSSDATTNSPNGNSNSNSKSHTNKNKNTNNTRSKADKDTAGKTSDNNEIESLTKHVHVNVEADPGENAGKSKTKATSNRPTKLDKTSPINHVPMGSLAAPDNSVPQIIITSPSPKLSHSDMAAIEMEG